MNFEPPPDHEREEKRGWAAKQLQLPGPGEATAEAASLAMLRLLPEEDWVPPERAHSALHYLHDDPDGTDETTPAEWREREAALRTELDAFAAEFFDLTIPERAKRLVELDRRAAPFPRQHAWLQQLSRGVKLDIKSVSEPDEKVANLVRLQGELFVMRPAERAARWQTELKAMSADFSSWERAATAVRKRHPSLVSMLPGPIQQLTDWKAADKRIARASQIRQIKATQATKPGRANMPGNRVAVWGIVVVVGWIISAISSSTSSRHSPNYTPYYNPPSHSTDNNNLNQTLKELENELMKRRQEGKTDSNNAFDRLYNGMTNDAQNVKRPAIAPKTEPRSSDDH